MLICSYFVVMPKSPNKPLNVGPKKVSIETSAALTVNGDASLLACNFYGMLITFHNRSGVLGHKRLLKLGNLWEWSGSEIHLPAGIIFSNSQITAIKTLCLYPLKYSQVLLLITQSIVATINSRPEKASNRSQSAV